MEEAGALDELDEGEGFHEIASHAGVVGAVEDGFFAGLDEREEAKFAVGDGAGFGEDFPGAVVWKGEIEECDEGASGEFGGAEGCGGVEEGDRIEQVYFVEDLL